MKSAAEAKRERRIDYGPLTGFIAFHLRQAQDASFRAFLRDSHEADLKPGRFAVLMILHYNPGITQTELGRAIARDKSTVTPLVQDLERHGWVERKPLPSDRRNVVLSLSRPGEAYLNRLLKTARTHDRRLDKIVGAAKPELLRLLRLIIETLA